MLTTEQRATRKGKIGSSDVAALFKDEAGHCMHPYRNAGDVWAYMTGRVQEKPDDTEGQAIGVGNMMERALLEWFQEQSGMPLQMDVPTLSFGKYEVSHPDALVISKPQAVEAKTAGVVGFPFDYDQWGEDGTDEIPGRYMLQAHHQMLLGDFDTIWFPVLIGMKGRRLYEVKRSDKLCSVIRSEIDAFIENYVIPDIPPPDAPSMQTLAAMRRQPTSRQIDWKIVKEWQEKAEARKQAEAAETMAKALVIAALGDSEQGECELGIVTYKEQTRKEHTVKASTFRVPRFKALKGDK